MSIFMQATLEVKASHLQELLEALNNKLFPLIEDQGWVLHGCFVHNYGPVEPSIITDLWELKSVEEFTRVLTDPDLLSHPDLIEVMSILEKARISEKVQFMTKAGGKIEKVL